MTYAPKEKHPSASPARSANKPVLRTPRVSEPHAAHEQEADRAADLVMSGRHVPAWSISKVSVGNIQRQTSGDQPSPKPNNYDEAAKKLGEAFLQTDVGKKLTDAAKQDPLVKGAEGFIDTLPGKIIAGAAAVGAVSALAATHTALPAQIPEIPLDSIRPGLSVKITYEGPVDHPTKAAITFSYSPKGEEKKPKQTASERYRSETARIAADQEKFRAGMRYKPGSAEDIQQAQEKKAVDDYVMHRFGALPGTGGQPLIPSYPGLKESPDTGLRSPTFESPFKPKPIHVFDQQLQLQPLTPSNAPSEEEKKEEPNSVQRKAESGATAVAKVPASARNAVRSQGLPLEAGTRRLMESRFEADFSDVRVHTDSKAADSAKALNARAYTLGDHITFAAGEYSPETTQGRKLLIHELTHVVQQSGSAASSAESAALEHEAECAAQEPYEGKPHVAKASGVIGIARAPGGEDARQVAQALVKQMQAANKPVVVNVGGTGAAHEPGDAINVNPNVVAPRKDIPNLVQAKGEEIGTLFDAGQVENVVGNRLSPDVFDWERVAGGAHDVLQDGGTIKINFRWASKEAAENLVRALTNAGFKDVKNVANVFITAVKGSGGAPPGSGGVVPGTGAAVTPSTGAGGSALKAATTEGEPAPIPKVEGTTGVTAEIAGAAAEVESVGVAARVAGIALETAAGLVIGIAIGLFLDWLKGKIEEAALKRDLQALSPQIQTKLQALVPRITQLQQQGSKVYSRVTVGVTRRSGGQIASEGGYLATATWDNYEGVALVGVDVAGDAAPSARSEREERLSPNESRIHSVETFSTLIDDPQKRARVQQNAKLIEHLKKVAPPSLQQESKSTPTQPPPLLQPPGTQQTTPTFNPFPNAPGQSPIAEAGNVIQNFKTKCQELLTRGERLISTSNSEKKDIDAFKHDEDLWRTAATLAKNYYTDHGPDTGASGMDELLNSDHYGGRLKQIRNILGG